MSDDDEVCVLRERVSAVERDLAVLVARLDAAREALVIQAAEYERRLDALNHAHEQQVENNQHFVSRESWELKANAHEQASLNKHKEIDARIYELDKSRWIILGAASVVGAIVSFMIRLITK